MLNVREELFRVIKIKEKINEKTKMSLWRSEAEINLDGDLAKIVKCNCSICKRKGAIMSMVKNEDFKIVKGEDKLKLYQFHSKVAKHYFCSNCGIYTHHNPRSNPAMTGFNLGCVDEINTFDLKDITLIDGQNHPLDQKK